MKIEKELSEAVQHVTGGDLDKLSLDKLYWFATITRGMADLAEAEMRRRGTYTFPVFHQASNR